MAERIDRMRLARTDRIGPATYRRLMHRYGTAAAAISALPGLARAGGGSPPRPIARALAEREFDRAERFGAQIVFVDEPAYPTLLGLLHDPPPALIVMGDPALLSVPAVAIVGSRAASANGCTIAESLAEALAAQDLAVVSGLARGIDAAAHAGALRKGLTVACIAGGLDKPYPPEHAALQERIGATGVVVTEAPFGTSPQARHFPRRNRIIAGLALGVVVIEAAQRSGSLITARMALENGRELFSVPGSPLDPRCRGSNDLIRQGAHLTETIEDILADLPPLPSGSGLPGMTLMRRADGALSVAGVAPHMAEAAPAWQDAADEVGHLGEQPGLRDRLSALLSATPTSVDDLVDRCQVSPSAVGAILLELELAGRVQFLVGHRVMLIASHRGPRAEPE